jgi:secreted trypsin-like serine protease
VPQGTYPFAAFVQQPNSTCTGSLITALHVLTAAHCVNDANDVLVSAFQFTVTIGRASRLNPPPDNVFFVDAVARHPGWQRPGINDLAILTLSQAVPNYIAQPIPIVGANDTRFDSPGQSAIAVGWGRTIGGVPTSSSPDLLEVGLTVISDAACEAEHRFPLDDATILCAQVPAKTTCQGDSGGPLFVAPPAAAATDQAKHAPHKDAAKAERKKKRRRPPLPPSLPPTSETQIAVTSFGLRDCPPGSAVGFVQLSDPTNAAFIDSVLAQ